MFLPKLGAPAVLVSVLVLQSACGGGSDAPRPPPNAAPVLTSTAFAATEDTPFSGQLAATDAENHAVTYVRVNDVQQGQITISASGAIAYTPAANFSGADTFSVRVTDSVGASSTSNVTLNVAGVNDAPAFVSPALSTDEDTVLNSQLTTYATDPDSNALNFTVTTAPAHGTLTLTAGGAAAYSPATNYNGADSWSIQVTDGAGGEANGTVSINVIAVNDAPVLTVSELSMAEDGVLTAQLATTDVENQVAVFQVGGPAGHGQVSISPTGL
ncbi:MAG TPA: Ig-like domain-containing protein, partial [Steroidobacteraceae bacterium]|nr:Ig-like domain-containing protein [Steroidobacteraceae bacterium]